MYHVNPFLCLNLKIHGGLIFYLVPEKPSTRMFYFSLVHFSCVSLLVLVSNFAASSLTRFILFCGSSLYICLLSLLTSPLFCCSASIPYSPCLVYSATHVPKFASVSVVSALKIAS